MTETEKMERERLAEQRNELLNSLGRGPYLDGLVEEEVRQIDAYLAEPTD